MKVYHCIKTYCIAGALERFAAPFYARVRSAPKNSLELSLGERVFATYSYIEIQANNNGVLNFRSSVLCLCNSDSNVNEK